MFVIYDYMDFVDHQTTCSSLKNADWKFKPQHKIHLGSTLCVCFFISEIQINFPFISLVRLTYIVHIPHLGCRYLCINMWFAQIWNLSLNGINKFLNFPKSLIIKLMTNVCRSSKRVFVCAVRRASQGRLTFCTHGIIKSQTLLFL